MSADVTGFHHVTCVASGPQANIAFYTGVLGLRLVKTPKVLLGDTGLLCHLLGLDAARLQADDLMTGAALECFVARLHPPSMPGFQTTQLGGTRYMIYFAKLNASEY